MDLSYYRISLFTFICTLFFACVNDDIDDSSATNDFFYNNIAAFHSDYNSNNYNLTIYLEFLLKDQDSVFSLEIFVQNRGHKLRLIFSMTFLEIEEYIRNKKSIISKTPYVFKVKA